MRRALPLLLAIVLFLGASLIWIGSSRVVELLVLRHALYAGVLAELGRRIELAGLSKYGIDILILSCLGLRHGSPEGWVCERDDFK